LAHARNKKKEGKRRGAVYSSNCEVTRQTNHMGKRERGKEFLTRAKPTSLFVREKKKKKRSYQRSPAQSFSSVLGKETDRKRPQRFTRKRKKEGKGK